MSEHTKEPWYMHASGRIYSDFLGFIASTNLIGSSQVEIDGNARRIVACINSCIGIPTDFLEAFGELNPVILEGEEAKKQRDALLTALKELMAAYELVSEYPCDNDECMKNAHNLIAEIEGDKS